MQSSKLRPVGVAALAGLTVALGSSADAATETVFADVAEGAGSTTFDFSMEVTFCDNIDICDPTASNVIDFDYPYFENFDTSLGPLVGVKAIIESELTGSSFQDGPAPSVILYGVTYYGPTELTPMPVDPAPGLYPLMFDMGALGVALSEYEGGNSPGFSLSLSLASACEIFCTATWEGTFRLQYEYEVDMDVAPVPLPASLPLGAAAIAGLGIVGAQRQRKRAR